MRTNFSQTLQDHQQRTIEATQRLLPAPENDSGRSPLTPFFEACRYSVESGGKRVRSLLVRAAAQVIDKEIKHQTLDTPCVAVELVHSYSLIHDDLPAMDDDDLRRGKPSLHKAFDEATAILVGDGLQAKAFELLACAPGLSAQQRVSMIEALSVAAGCDGMVGGQFIDIQATNSGITIEQLQTMHSLKTGALIRASLKLGGIAASGSEAQLQALDDFGDCIGLAFQVVDDILDVEGDTMRRWGKPRAKTATPTNPPMSNYWA